MWFKVDDHLHDHQKVRKVDDLAAMGLWTLAGSWCGDQGTDGFVPSSVLRRWSSSWKRLAVKLVEAEMWQPAEHDGEAGFQFVNWTTWQPTRDQAKLPTDRIRWRRAKALHRDRELCEAICQRDRNQCRYCGVRVNWKDRVGKTGGTYDHVDPDGDNSLPNVVVACRRCNGQKRDRTPAEARMELLPVPSPDLAGARSGASPELAETQPPARHAREAGPGQVGAGSEPDRARSDRSPGPGPFDDTTTTKDGDQAA